MRFYINNKLVCETRPIGYWCDACHLPLTLSGDKKMLHQTDKPQPHLNKCVLCGREAGRSMQIIRAYKMIWYVPIDDFRKLAEKEKITNEEGDTFTLKYFLQEALRGVVVHVINGEVI